MASTDTAASILPSPPAPGLPHFDTLLIQGDYPPSSPFHLCLSHISRSTDDARPILVTAKPRSEFIERLVELNDGWLVANAGLGATADLLSRIQIFYPSTPDHWVVLFSLLQTGALKDSESLPPNVHLDQPVSLVVLHELSAYFLGKDFPKIFTINSYLHLITSTLASIRSLNADTRLPLLVLFDSRLHELTLPIVGMKDPIVSESEQQKNHDIVVAVEKYFDWIGRVNESELDVDHHDGSTCQIYLSPSQYSRYQGVPLIWQWRTRRLDRVDGAQRTIFQWDTATR